MEENKNMTEIKNSPAEPAASVEEPGSGTRGGTGGRRGHKAVLLAAVLIAACAAGYGYYYNLPAQRLDRAMQAADTLMEQAQYEQAVEKYTEASGIDPENEEAREGALLALKGQADALAGSREIADRAGACALYREIRDRGSDIRTEDNAERIDALLEESDEKLENLEQGIAAEYESVETITTTDDRSGKVIRPDGSETPYTWHYDLVQIEDPWYPYADEINAILARERDNFFARSDSTPPQTAAAGTADGEYRDYVGVAGIYSGEGMLSIRMAEVRVQGTSRVNYYRGVTLRLSDAEPVSLADLTGKTESGVRRLVRRSIAGWVEDEGYRDISQSVIEDYAEETDLDAFKYCIREDGKACLLIDQEVPFFRTATEILEIPLEY